MIAVEGFRQYVQGLYYDVPKGVYIGLFILFLFCLVLIMFSSGKNERTLTVNRLMLFEYLALVLCSTVLLRSVNENRHYNFAPLWSYESIQNGHLELIAENAMNVVAFFPIGFLLGCSFRRMCLWKVIMIGTCLSATVEGLQFYYKRGFSEVDDVIHNTIGCLLGYCAFCMLTWLVRKYRTQGNF